MKGIGVYGKNMENEKNTITFCTEDGDEVLFHVIEETKINGVNYLLVLDDIEDEEAEALILKDMSEEAESDAVYEIVDDETELTAIAKVFEELLEDMELVTGENDSDDEE